jgi:hypothetical protein
VKGITGRPAAGARLSVDRAEEGPEGVTYRGFVYLPEAEIPIEARVALPGGAVRTVLGPGGSTEMEKWTAALVRAATKAPAAAGAPLPRKIVRWRG